MGFHGRTAAHKPKITMCSAKNQLQWCKAHCHWTLEKWKSVLWRVEYTIHHLAVRQANLGFDGFQENITCPNA
jgi:hypothetical protein